MRRTPFNRLTGFAVALAVAASVVISTGDVASAAPVVRLRAIFLSNDDGTNAGVITPQDFKEYVDVANQVWAGAATFKYDPVADSEFRASTLMNNDCLILSQDTCDKQPVATARDALALDSAHFRTIPVFVRYGGADFSCSAGVCANQATSLSYSSRAGHIVVLASSGVSEGILAHELGHYFWNTHTFRSKPTSVSQAAATVRAYIENNDLPKSRGLEAFDGDRNENSDTPPDPGEGLWTVLKGSDCATSAGANSAKLTVKFSDGKSYDYTLAPDRTNIMSYYLCSDLGYSSAPGQRERMRKAIEEWNRSELAGSVPSFASTKSKWTTEALPSKLSLFAPYMSAGRQHVFAYSKQTGAARVFVLTNEGVETLWSGTWTTGYTSATPLTLNGLPHVLLHRNSGDGMVKLMRMYGDGTSKLRFQTKWSLGYTHVTPFVEAGQDYVAVYKKGNGTVRTLRIKADATGWHTIWSGKWPTNRTQVRSFVAQGKPHILSYRTGDGVAQIERVNAGGHGFTLLKTHGWTSGWSQMATFDRGTQPRILSYKLYSGVTDIDRTGASGKVVNVVRETWGTGLSATVPVKHNGIWHVLLYTSTGKAEFREIAQ